MSEPIESLSHEKLRNIISDFYDKVFDDVFIGYFFVGLDKDHLVEMQVQFVTALLGGERNYRGRPIRAAHAPHGIRPAHFGRRQVILQEVLRDHGVGEEIVQEWLARESALKNQVLG